MRNAIDRAIEELVAEKQYNVKRCGKDKRTYVIEEFFVIEAETGIVGFNRLKFKINSYVGKQELKRKIKRIVENRLKRLETMEFHKRQRPLFDTHNK